MPSPATPANRDDDKISSLPDHVKHHILSFLPSVKEVARTSSLSKSWLRVWRSFQISDFNYLHLLPEHVRRNFMLIGGRYFVGGAKDFRPQYVDSFVRFVDDAMSRSHDGMRSFCIFTILDTAAHVDRWLGMALDIHVQELSITLLDFYNANLLYSIPRRILSAEFISSLKLTGDVKIDGFTGVNLPSLRTLGLGIYKIDSDMLQRFLGGCPLLEDLSVLYCGVLSKIEVSNLNYLKRLTVTSSSRVTLLELVNVDASSLEMFCFNCSFPHGHSFHLEVHGSPNLRSFEFGSNCSTDEWLCRFLAKFPRLEHLKLTECNLLERIRISNPVLKEMVVENCSNLVDIRIDTPKLALFYFKSCTALSPTNLPFIWTEDRPYTCALGFTCSFFDEDPNGCWLQELKKFLNGSSATFGCTESTLCLYAWEEVTPDELDEKLDLSRGPIQHLKLYFGGDEWRYPMILDGLFSCCRPTTIKLRVHRPFLKFICERFASWEENPRHCSCGVKCWRDELKDVKIERVKGVECDGPLDWCTLFSLLPNLSTSNEVRLRLRWLD